MKLIINPKMVEFYRKPKHRRKRVMKKWMKKSENYRPMTYGIQTPIGLICHPVLARAIREMEYAADEPYRQLFNNRQGGEVK